MYIKRGVVGVRALEKDKCHSDTREPRPHNRISVTIYLNIGLMVCDMFPTPQPSELAIYEPCSSRYFITATDRMVPWPSWLRHRANNAGISGSIPLGTSFSLTLEHFSLLLTLPLVYC